MPDLPPGRLGGDAMKRESEDTDAPEAKVAKGESSNGKPAGACSWSSGGGGGFGALSAAGGFGGVASSGCSWSTGGGGGFASFGSGGGGGGGFGALAASGGGFGSAAAPSAADEAPAAAVPEMGRTFSGATTSPFGQRKASTEAPGSTESAGSETKDDEESVVLKGAGEENEVCIHKVRGKLFRLETRVKKLVEESVQVNDEEDEGEDAEAATPAAAAPASAPASAAPAPAAAKEATDDAEATPKPAASASSGAEGAETTAAGADGDMETRWVERGVGQVKLLKPKEGVDDEGAEVKARLVMRVEPHYSRLILNAPLLPTTAAIERPSDTSLRLVLHSAESASETPSKPSSFILRVKTSAEAQALLAAINKCIPG